MNWSSERWNLRRDGSDRQVYFPFGLFGRGFEVRTVERYNQLREHEGTRRVCLTLFFLATYILAKLLDATNSMHILLPSALIAYEIATGLYLRRRAPDLVPLANQPSEIERAADAAEISIRGGYAMVVCLAGLLGGFGVIAAVWIGDRIYGAILITLAALLAAKCTVAFFRLARNSHQAGNTE